MVKRSKSKTPKKTKPVEETAVDLSADFVAFDDVAEDDAPALDVDEWLGDAAAVYGESRSKKSSKSKISKKSKKSETELRHSELALSAIAAHTHNESDEEREGESEDDTPSYIDAPKKRTRKRKQRVVTLEDEEEEARLESILFGDTQLSVVASADTDEPVLARKKSRVERQRERLFVFDEHSESESESESVDGDADRELQPAWEDDDVTGVNVHLADAPTSTIRKLRTDESEVAVSGREFENRLRKKYNNAYGGDKSWAKIQHSDDENSSDSETEAIRGGVAGPISLRSGGGSLTAGRLEMTRLQDANQLERSNATINALNFHPSAEILLTGGFDRTLRFFQIDGKRNSKLQSVFFKDMPISYAKFTPSGNEVLLTGRRRFYYVYDVMSGAVTKVNGIKGRSEKSLEKCVQSKCGKYTCFLGHDGYAILLSSRTRQWIANFKMNGVLNCADFSPDGKFLYTAGADGEVYEWDIGQRRCVTRFVDDGARNTVTVGVSNDGQYLTTGHESGVVNLYDRSELHTLEHKSSDARGAHDRLEPIKSFLNLRTEVHTVQFNHDSQVLAMCSAKKKDALKMVHVPSRTVFSNWPSPNTPLHYVSAFDFSRRSGYFTVGNARGHVLLYRVNHYLDA